MNKLEIIGIITQILEIQTGDKKDGSGQWEKQSFIVDTGTQYNNIYCFEVFGDQKVDNFKKFNKVGQEVTVEFNVNTNEYKEKFYTTLNAWKIIATPSQTPNANQFTPQEKQAMGSVGTAPFETVSDVKNDDHDDLPF
jgi:hypothetical protein